MSEPKVLELGEITAKVTYLQGEGMIKEVVHADKQLLIKLEGKFRKIPELREYLIGLIETALDEHKQTLTDVAMRTVKASGMTDTTIPLYLIDMDFKATPTGIDFNISTSAHKDTKSTLAEDRDENGDLVSGDLYDVTHLIGDSINSAVSANKIMSIMVNGAYTPKSKEDKNEKDKSAPYVVLGKTNIMYTALGINQLSDEMAGMAQAKRADSDIPEKAKISGAVVLGVHDQLLPIETIGKSISEVIGKCVPESYSDMTGVLIKSVELKQNPDYNNDLLELEFEYHLMSNKLELATKYRCMDENHKFSEETAEEISQAVDKLAEHILQNLDVEFIGTAFMEAVKADPSLKDQIDVRNGDEKCTCPKCTGEIREFIEATVGADLDSTGQTIH